MKKIPVFCGKDCGGNACPLVLTIDEGHAMSLSANPASDGLALPCVRGFNLIAETHAPERLLHPLSRTGPRGSGQYKQIGWDEALDRIAAALARARDSGGPESVLDLSSAGSIGAVHTTQTIAARFFSFFGGCTATTGSYSNGAARSVLPYLFGADFKHSGCDASTMADANLIVLWGANVLEARLGSEIPKALLAARAAGTPVISIDPRRTSTVSRASTRWIPVRPGTDAALMLALLYVLFDENLARRDFARARSTGFDELEAYVTGRMTEGQAMSLGLDPKDIFPRTPRWAESLCGIPASDIADLARTWAAIRPAMLLPGYSIQRVAGGEECFRLTVALQLATGNTGLRGGSTGSLNNRLPEARCGSLPVPDNPEARYAEFPVLRWPDAILRGRKGGYPSDITAAIVAGSNPLTQGADLAKSRAALEKLEFLAVADLFMTPTAQVADIVLPAASPLEKEDIGRPWFGNYLLYKPAALPPAGEARNDYDIFAGIAERLGFGPAFTEGRSASDWVDWCLDHAEVPDPAAFKKTGFWGSPQRSRVGLEDFGRDPASHPLATGSGKIELLSQAYLKDTGCPAIPSWRPGLARSEGSSGSLPGSLPGNSPGRIPPFPEEESPTAPLSPVLAAGWSGPAAAEAEAKPETQSEEGPEAAGLPLLLVTPKLAERTHSQLWSVASLGMEHKHVLSLHPDDAQSVGLKEGDMALIRSRTGSALARTHLTTDIMQGVACLPEGAWHPVSAWHPAGAWQPVGAWQPAEAMHRPNLTLPDGLRPDPLPGTISITQSGASRDTLQDPLHNPDPGQMPALPPSHSPNELTSTRGTEASAACIMHGLHVTVKKAGPATR